ncbi:hypothetical protein D3C85_1390920 [compost metagenome]
MATTLPSASSESAMASASEFKPRAQLISACCSASVIVESPNATFVMMAVFVVSKSTSELQSASQVSTLRSAGVMLRRP